MLFSDIVVPLKAVGVDLDIKPGVGPVIAQPIRSAADLDQLRPLEPDDVVLRRRGRARAGGRARRDAADRVRRRAVHPRVLPRRGRPVAQPRAHQGPDVRRAGRLGRADAPGSRRSPRPSCTSRSRRARAPCSCSTRGSARCPRPTTSATCSRTRPRCSASLEPTGVPRIHFGVGTGELLRHMAEAGADVVGVDFRLPLDEAVPRIGPGRAVQGNLDPAVLFAPWEAVAERTRAVLAAGRAAPGPRVQPRPRRASPTPTPTSSPASSTWCTRRPPRADRLRRPQASVGGRRRRGGGRAACCAAPGTPVRPSSDQHRGERQQRPEHGQRHQRDRDERVPAVAQPGEEAEVVLLGRRRDGLAGRDQRHLDRGEVGDVLRAGRAAACSDSRSASRRASSDSICTTSPIVSASPSSVRTGRRCAAGSATRLLVSAIWVVTSWALRLRLSSRPRRPSPSRVAANSVGGTRRVSCAWPVTGPAPGPRVTGASPARTPPRRPAARGPRPGPPPWRRP